MTDYLYKGCGKFLMWLCSNGVWPKSGAAFPTADVPSTLRNGFVVTSSDILARRDLWRSLVQPVLNAGSMMLSRDHRRCGLTKVSIMQEVMWAACPETKLEIIHSPKKWVCGGHQLQHKGQSSQQRGRPQQREAASAGKPSHCSALGVSEKEFKM